MRRQTEPPEGEQMVDLQSRGVNKNFGAVQVITDVGLDVGDGEFDLLLKPYTAEALAVALRVQPR